MKIMKYRLCNKYLILGSLILFSCLLFSWIFASDFFLIMTQDYNAPDLSGTKEEIQPVYLYQILDWEGLIDSSMFYLIDFIPVLFILPTLALFNEKRSFFVLGRSRFTSLKKEIYRSVFCHTMISAVTTVLTLLAYFSIGGLFVHRSLDDIGGFASMLPDNFYQNHPYLFFVFLICSIYFALAFSFSFLSATTVLIFEKEYQVIVFVLIFYLIYGQLGVISNSSFFDIFSSFTAFNTLKNTYEVFLPIFPILGISALFLWYGTNKIIKTEN